MSIFVFRFALINAGVLFVYFTNFQKIDDEDYGGPMELTKEGFFTSFSLFLVGLIHPTLLLFFSVYPP